MEKNRITVFTPTYNRASTLFRVYNSLKKQTYKDFCWLIIDDGSNDNTKEIVEKYITEAEFDIIYRYQDNAGKHVAVNRAAEITTTELFIIADSDDGFDESALEIMINAWDSIPVDKKQSFKGVNCRCFEHETKKPIGRDFSRECFDSNDLEAYFKLKLRSEKWNLFRTEVLREYPFPEISGIKFFPETVTWQQMARKYQTRYINTCLREYYKDQVNSVTNGKQSVRYRENIHLWIHLINNTFEYFPYYPQRFIQSFVGLSRDGILNGYSFKEIHSMPNTRMKKCLYLIFYPCGYVLAKQNRRKRG